MLALTFMSCQSGDRGSRTGHSDDSPLEQAVVERAKFLKNLNPSLTEEKALFQAAAEVGSARWQEAKKLKAKEDQDKFKEDLARSLEK